MHGVSFRMVLRVVLPALLWAASVGCSKSADGDQGCLAGIYECFTAGGDCLLRTDDAGQVTVTWDDGATVVGPVLLAAFDAFGPDGQLCFQRAMDGSFIVISGSDGASWRVERSGSGATTVTCPDGKVQEHPAGEFPSTAVGIDPARLIGCRVAGICSIDGDCEEGQVCCGGKCHTGERCPGTCEKDEHCGEGNRCCDGLCTSLPACKVPCMADSQCDDGVYCNGLETCVDNLCKPELPILCDDRIDCTLDSCDEAVRDCVHVARDELCGPEQRCNPDRGCVDIIYCTGDGECDDQDPCTSGACLGGICEFESVPGCCHQDADCSDGIFCNGEETCVGHACADGTPPECDDGIDCTTDICDPASDDCAYLPNHDLCGAEQMCDLSLGCIDRDDCPDDVYEENDTRSDAVLLPNGLPSFCFLCPDDADWFKFEFDQVGLPMFIFTTSPAYGTMEITMYDGEGAVIEYEVQQETGGLLMFTYPDGGLNETVWIEVVGEDDSVTGDYMLVLQFG